MEKSSPLVFDRYELKYLIPLSMVDEISRHIEAYCELDPYSVASPDHYYHVNSLYLDTPNYLFLRRKLAGISDRFNMRIRGYGTDVFFLEMKIKSKGFVKKRRVYCKGDIMAALGDPEEGLGISTGNKGLFINAFHSYNVEPKVLTQYKRKAYFSKYDDYARITFDRDLKYAEERDFTTTPNPKLMNNYDSETIFADGTCVVLELKCPQLVPLWFLDIITKFDLKRTGFSKYSSSVMALLPDLRPVPHDRVCSV